MNGQPIAALETLSHRCRKSAEALRKPVYATLPACVNLLPPGSFFPILDAHNLLPHLDRWVVKRLSRWVSSALSIKPDWSIPVSNINLSDATLADSDFGEYVHSYVDDSFLSNGALSLLK